MTEIASSSRDFSTWDCSSSFVSPTELLAHDNHDSLKELHLEFISILKSKCALSVVGNSVSLSASITDSNSISLHYQDFTSLHSILSPEDVMVLRGIAEILSSTEYYNDCVQAYIRLRKDIINMIYEILEGKINMEAVREFEYSEELKQKIQRWIQIAKMCIGNIFVREKVLYQQIFEGLGSDDDGDSDNFVYIIGNVAAKLFQFPDSVMASRRLPQRLDIFLPLNQELLNLMPTVNELFCKNSSLPRNIHAYATGIMSRFSEHMTKALSTSEGHVLRELSMNPTPGGGIHSLTEYVIGYMDLISLHRKSLTDLIATTQALKDPNAPELDSSESDSSPLKHHLIRIIEFLIYNLRYKSKFYEKESLNHLFMMNNIHCVAQKIRSSQSLRELIGIKFLKELTLSVERAKNEYLSSWDGICCCLRDNERSKSHAKWSFFPWKSARDVKVKLKTFYQKLENVSEIQEEWEVSDPQLTQKLHQSILDMLLPAYSDFIGEFSGHIAKAHIKYSVKDLETKVLNMF
ncbi:hypothetical protein M9H77_34234 [Catharanthus roseus]|uniref:Uncharacterized protein n=1 Tax=Catharanthus roseus TaxID=4058 RepID=A0ACB9ZKN7_CATRO|nr:hypothetical protein M9H77_34234 [Catharanthus roseus]